MPGFPAGLTGRARQFAPERRKAAYPRGFAFFAAGPIVLHVDPVKDFARAFAGVGIINFVEQHPCKWINRIVQEGLSMAGGCVAQARRS